MPNALALEKSPYLLQHKDNPVDWRPWGPEAFRAAREAGKPLLLSIGYSTCHWCHVMERESFEDPAVAAVMNARFVCVKLDREERPDVDKVYMTAVQAMTGQGGWPLNVFLTPELKPFFGGTYFPPSARWGQPGWVQLLERIAELWRTRRRDLEGDAERLAKAVSGFVAAEAARERPKADVLAAAEVAFAGAFDPEHAGFGGAPKFPMPAYQRFLLRRGGESRKLAVASLRAMARGGIFDQLGGGFHRYSTDDSWRVPHFEKMLYDNAQLLENLADALRAGRDAELERALRATVGYLSRDLRGAHGAFHSAEDADSEGREGAFYVWAKAEVAGLLGRDAEAFCARYGVVEPGEFEDANVLYDKDPAALPESAAAAARAKLLAARAKRPRPSLDDKVLASWNGLALSGLARAHAATGDADCLALARGAADFLRREMCSEDGASLWHRWREGERAVAGLADDYAFVAAGLLDLYEVSFEPERLAWALQLAEEALRRFAAPGGGLYQTAAGEASELFARAVEDHDGVEPAASSVLAEACLRLHALTGREPLRRFAEETLERFGPRLAERPLALPYLLCALDRALSAPKVVVIAGLDRPGARELLAAARAEAGTSVAGFTRATQDALARLVPGVAEIPDAPRAQAYVCEGGACRLPTP